MYSFSTASITCIIYIIKIYIFLDLLVKIPTNDLVGWMSYKRSQSSGEQNLEITIGLSSFGLNVVKK